MLILAVMALEPAVLVACTFKVTPVTFPPTVVVPEKVPVVPEIAPEDVIAPLEIAPLT